MSQARSLCESARLQASRSGCDWCDQRFRCGTRLNIIANGLLRFVLGADGAAVTTSGGRSVPVYLWPVSEPARRSLGGSLNRMSDTSGRFRFETLPPGEYRMLASFDVYEPDADIIELSRAPAVTIEAGETVEIELPVCVAPY